MELNSLCHSNDQFNSFCRSFYKENLLQPFFKGRLASAAFLLRHDLRMSLFICVFKRCCHQMQTLQLTAVFETCHASSSLCHVPDENCSCGKCPSPCCEATFLFGVFQGFLFSPWVENFNYGESCYRFLRDLSVLGVYLVWSIQGSYRDRSFQTSSYIILIVVMNLHFIL